VSDGRRLESTPSSGLSIQDGPSRFRRVSPPLRVLILIPARGGSRELPGKNLLPAGGSSLVARAIEAARGFQRLASLNESRLVVDTDSPEIAAEAERWGVPVPFLRPAKLAGDAVPIIDSVLHALERPDARYGSGDAVILLQPTSPLRTAEDIQHCWNAFRQKGCLSVASVARGKPAALSMRLNARGFLERGSDDPGPLARRQHLPQSFFLSGAVYISAVSFLREKRAFVVPELTRGVVLPKNRSVDIDTEDDLALADALLRARTTPMLAIGQHRLGTGARCFLIAEAGVNHNGDVEMAHRLVEAAAAAGVDAVKFQTFAPEFVVAPGAKKASYQETGGEESQLEMLRHLALPRDAHEELQAHADEQGLLFLSTAFDQASLDFLERLGTPAFKIASGEITNHPFLAKVAQKGKPVLLSTGMATLSEVGLAIDVLRDNGSPPLALMHCVTNYPAAPTESNLRAMETLRSAFEVPVGWSDHTLGVQISIAAAAMGAQLIEKHFTLDKQLPGPDHGCSLEPAELGELVNAVRAVEAAFGTGEKLPAPAELPLRSVVRRSLHAAADLSRGHVLTDADLLPLRPGDGIPPSKLADLLGRSLVKPLRQGQMLKEEDLGA